MNKSLVMCSGGLDSVVALYYALNRYDEVSAICFDYDQSHKMEIESAKTVCSKVNVPLEIIELGPILKGTSPLVNKNEKLETYKSHKEMKDTLGKRVELTYVPMRNSLFYTIAANRALINNTLSIVSGIREADFTNFPDCTSKYINAQEKAIQEACGVFIELNNPILELTRTQTINLALCFPGCYEALGYTHTSYSPEYPPLTQDYATVSREQGFREFGIPDPLIARAWFEGHTDIPVLQENRYHIMESYETFEDMCQSIEDTYGLIKENSYGKK